ncbi:MAG: xylose isomerase, partial [Planifilum fulgidum]
VLDQVLERRYRSFTEGIGKEIVEGKADFHKLEQYVLDLTEIRNESGRTEEIKATINRYLLNALK